VNRSIQSLLDQQREKIDRQWIASIALHVQRVQAALDRFMADGSTAELLELDTEEYARVFESFDALCLMGVRFSPEFVQRISEVRNSLTNTDIDADQDAHDEGILEEAFRHRVVDQLTGLKLDGLDD
jgi:hypothetical protein